MEIDSLIPGRRPATAWRAAVLFLLAWLGTAALPAQQPDASSVIRGVDAAVRARFEGIAEYTVLEHYAIFRGGSASKPMAEMTVKDHYRKNFGKSYVIVSQSGPEIIKKMAFGSLLDSEKRINDPATRETTWLTSANYEMKLKPGGPERIGGRQCFAVTITPRQSVANLIVGTIWVDAKDDSIVEIRGMLSKNPSVWTGPTQITRQYARVSGFAMAAHARAESNSFLFGKIVVTVDYQDYHLQLRPEN